MEEVGEAAQYRLPMKISNPRNVQRCVHVEWDEETQSFKGLPDVWKNVVPKELCGEDTDTKGLGPHVAPSKPPKNLIHDSNEKEKERGRERNLLTGLLSHYGNNGTKSKASPVMEIGLPYAVVHETHVGVDTRSSTGFTGLPPTWRSMLKSSGISKEDVSKHPQEVLDVLQFHMEGPPQKLPTRQTLQRNMFKAVEIRMQNPRDFIALKETIGEGSSGVVWRAVDKRDNAPCAVKISSMDEYENLKKEIGIHALTRHENIVQYRETFVVKNELWIVMELMSGGCLTDTLGRFVHWHEPHIAFVCKNVLQGLSFMHRHHRLHRDIKSDNILVDFNGNVKIADFGFAVGLTDEKTKRNSVVGKLPLQIL
mmetsp:Transcript_527/g.794  ORF Transcript_527/g.794 Transcript_527/m.794 type:complete len:367 (+) Transcript_527:36-1136(+)